LFFSFQGILRDFLSYSEFEEKTTLFRVIQPDEFVITGNSMEFVFPVKAGIYLF